MYTNVIITVALIGVALYFGAKLVTYYLNLPQKMEIEIRWKNQLITDLLNLSENDEVARDLFEKSNLTDFVVCDIKFINDRRSLIRYYCSVSSAVRDLLKCKKISHVYVSAEQVVNFEKKCREHKKCEQCNLELFQNIGDGRNENYTQQWENGKMYE